MLADPGGTLAPGQIYDVNRATLAAIVEQHGGVAAPLAIVRDDVAAIDAALREAAAWTAEQESAELRRQVLMREIGPERFF